MIVEQFREIKWRGHADRLGMHEFVVCAVVDAFEQRRGVIDKNIDMSAFRQNVVGKAFKRRFVGNVADKPWPLLDIDYMDDRPFVFKAFRAALSDSMCSTRDDDDFILERHFGFLYCIIFTGPFTGPFYWTVLVDRFTGPF